MLGRARVRARELGGVARGAWRLIHPYFAAPASRAARRQLVAVLVLLGLQVGISVEINQWNASFYNALQRHDAAEFYRQLARWLVLIALLIAVLVYLAYLRQLAALGWRTWLTERFSDRWLAADTAHAMEQARLAGDSESAPDNPDQRIAEDVRDFTGQTIELAFSFAQTLATLIAFVPILYGLSGDLDLGSVRVPGYMLIIACCYAVLGSALAHAIGHPLVDLNFRRQMFEADFRFQLVRVRESAEAIARAEAGPVERGALRQGFARVAGNWLLTLRLQKKVDGYALAYGQFSTVFPYLVMAPRFFHGPLKIGELVQTVSAFQQLLGSLSWLIGSYAMLAAWSATAQRLVRFEAALERVPG
ncbi:MAG: hypothetical protein JSR59_08025 [Proteobacteria bacterium]|nr:hypothetical protein [Pseudomonadota bacterium]